MITFKKRRERANASKRFLKARGSDIGTPERWQHSGRTFEQTERYGMIAARATEEHILDVLGLKLILTAQQIEAGLKLKADYQAAALCPHVTGSYSGLSNARDFFRTERERSDSEEQAYRRWRDAVWEMGLNGSAVIDTACYDVPPLPRDIPALQNGLDKLVAWYGLGKKTVKTVLRGTLKTN